MPKKEQKLPLIYIKDDPYEGVLVREYNGIHGYTLAECHGYDSKGIHSRSASLRVAQVIQVALQEAVDEKLNPLRVAPPTPNEPKSCLEECPLLKMIQEMCNAKK
jgi:hypothetical protein